MKTFSTHAAQGEISIRRIGDVRFIAGDAGYAPLPLEHGQMIIGHSETGHHHIIANPEFADVMVMDRPPEGMRILRAIVNEPTKLVHLREHDTHEAIDLSPGEYEFRIGREFDPFEEIARTQID